RGKFGASACCNAALSSSTDSAPVACMDSIILSLQHAPLVRIVVRDSRFLVSFLELCFFFYSVTDVISNVTKYNTSVKIYLSKSKITDLKKYLKITKYTKKLLNYSNVSKSNSLLYTSASMFIRLLQGEHYYRN